MSTLFNKDIKYLKGVGEKRAKLYNKLGVESVGALIYFFPRDYLDWRKPSKIADTTFDEKCCICAKVIQEIKTIRTNSGKIIYSTLVADDSGILQIKIFNNLYAAQSLKLGEEYCFSGKISGDFKRKEMLSPDFDLASKAKMIHPIYPQTAGLSNKMITANIKTALSLLPETIKDTIPEKIRTNYKLCSLMKALQNIHFPVNDDELKKAKTRLVFEEFITLQLGMLKTKSKKNTANCENFIQCDYSQEFFSLLPFTPTNAQLKVCKECMDDISSKKAMNRLIQGDVGSGKTAVAAALCYTVAKNNVQCAFMAPTEILAKQHFNFLDNYMKNKGINISLLTSSTRAKEKKIILESTESGNIDILIGTHSLLNDNLNFKNLGLVVTDEQHRFGVNQRTSLTKKGKNTNVLVMSATPIPRTLALMIYGDLDISILDELPAGRQGIGTYWINKKKETRAFEFIKNEIEKGRQAYIVCPLLEENESELSSACEYFDKLQKKYFTNHKLALIHGKMKASEKSIIMDDFSKNKINILVATTVVEVGVDVPNATVMMIVNAERFGLSQLHQLRGRVGRGKYNSHCILLSDAKGNESKARLSTMCKTNDGFEIADKDLKLRGPGDFFGSRQHGLPKLKVANLSTDIKILKQAQQAALQIIQQDPSLQFDEHRYLVASINRLFSDTNFILN